MITLKDFEGGATYPPILEASRLTRITDNRKLYNNDFRPHLKETADTNSVRINLFRKAIEIYVNFLLSEGVQIEFGESETDHNFEDRINHLVDVLYLVNTDSKRYGVGIVSIEQDTGLFKVFEPDQWYQIRGETGSLDAEVLVDYSDNALEIPKDNPKSENYSLITIIVNDYVTNKQTKTVRKLKGGKIGEQVGKVITLPIDGRQIAALYAGYAKGQEGVSVFDDIKDIVIDMVRIKQNLSKSLERNSNPHLAAPAGILVEDEQGTVKVNTQGMLFPMNPGDEKPFYLQWDTNAEAAKFQMEEHWKAYYATTSIPRMLFEPSIGGQTSGEALKRMLFPFLSVLSKLKTNNFALIRQLLVMYDNYLLVKGLPRLPTTTPTITMDYDKIFEDADLQNVPSEPEADNNHGI